MVDSHLQTANPDIYAAGDCIGNPMFVYVAAYGGQLAAENALTGAGKLYDLSALQRVTFTDPQTASVGLTERAARAQGPDVETVVLPLEHVPRAQAARNTNGLIKLIRERGTGRLLGAHALAPEAAEVIQGSDAGHPLQTDDERPHRDVSPVLHDGRRNEAGGTDVRQRRPAALVLRDLTVGLALAIPTPACGGQRPWVPCLYAHPTAVGTTPDCRSTAGMPVDGPLT